MENLSLCSKWSRGINPTSNQRSARLDLRNRFGPEGVWVDRLGSGFFNPDSNHFGLNLGRAHLLCALLRILRSSLI